MRETKRRNLVYYLDVKDTKSGEIIGKLADISLNGVLILSEDPIEQNFKGTIEILMPFEGFLDTRIPRIEVVRRWGKKNKTTDYFYFGLEITNSSIELEKAISILIAKIGFSDGEKKARRGLFSQDFY